MKQTIDSRLLRDLSDHCRQLSFKRIFQSLGYERCGELPLVTAQIESLFSKQLKYLDIGSGESVYPTYLLRRSNWDVTCLDKFAWVQRQVDYAKRVMGDESYEDRFHVLQQDFMNADLPQNAFDVITNISVIEHFDGTLDSEGMNRSAQLLKKGGLYILTTLINDGYFREFHLNKDIYGSKFQEEAVFFQRHYDVESFEKRLLLPSGLHEVKRFYFGDYDFQFCEKFMVMPWPWKPLKLFYQWATPHFAKRFLTYRDYPVSRPDMHMYTASGVCSVLTRK